MRRPSQSRLLPLLLLVLTLPACGVVFSAGFEGTEVFQDIELDSEFTPGSSIAVELTVNQAYSVPLAVSCRYENTDITDDQRRVAFNERTQLVFETVLPASDAESPGDDDDVPDETFEFEFIVPEPGDYFIACFTIASPENGIGQGFTIEES